MSDNSIKFDATGAATNGTFTFKVESTASSPLAVCDLEEWYARMELLGFKRKKAERMLKQAVREGIVTLTPKKVQP